MTKTPSLQQAAPDAGSDTGNNAEPDTEIKQQLLALQAENQKLRKINQALIERVEAGQNAVHTGPYAAFQHAAVLAEQVRERTAELSHAYDELRRSVRYSETLAQSERWIRTITRHRSIGRTVLIHAGCVGTRKNTPNAQPCVIVGIRC